MDIRGLVKLNNGLIKLVTWLFRKILRFQCYTICGSWNFLQRNLYLKRHSSAKGFKIKLLKTKLKIRRRPYAVGSLCSHWSLWSFLRQFNPQYSNLLSINKIIQLILSHHRHHHLILPTCVEPPNLFNESEDQLVIQIPANILWSHLSP